MARIKRFFSQFGITLLLVVLCLYLILQLTLGIGEVADVEQTTYVTVRDTVQLEAYLFRDETPLYSGTEGIDCFLVDNGDRVAKGTPVAVTYTEEQDATLQERITRINRMIRILELSNLSQGAQTTDLAILDKQIQALTVELLREIADGDLTAALRGEEALWVEMNRRQALLDDDFDYSAQINLLKQERADLEDSLRGHSVSVSAPYAGYYYNMADGYEDIFTVEALADLTVDSFDELLNCSPDNRILTSACGKMARDADWYVAVSLDKRSASEYTEGRSYELVFPYSTGMRLTMTLEKKAVQTNRDHAVLVFRSNVLPEGFDFTRRQTIQLVAGTYSGIRVSTDALRTQDGVLGCYVLDGNRVIFKKADVLYREEEFAVCRVPLNSVTGNRDDKAHISAEYVSLYDTVIISASELYEGQVLQ